MVTTDWKPVLQYKLINAVFSLTQTSSRQREIIEIVFSNGWDYMRGLLTGGKAGEPQIPPPEALRNILVELGPFYVKLGQLLSTRPDLLPASYIEALTALQANVPPVSWGHIQQVIRQELQHSTDTVFREINPEPVAAGSIGQIHRATLINGDVVALKVRRPGISKIVAQDSSLIKAIAELVSLSEFGKTYNIVQLADEFTRTVKSELDFTQEARYTDQLRRNLSKSSWFNPEQLVIPKIYWDITTEKLLVLEWLDGVTLLEADLDQVVDKIDPHDRRQEITTFLLKVFFQQIYIDGFFHADPHPGNIFYLKDGRIALIDCGMIGRLDPRTQQLLTEMLLAILDLDAQRCTQLTLELSESVEKINLSRLEVDYNVLLRKYYNLSLSQINFSEVFYEILQVARINKIKLPGNLGLYGKSLANLEGVARKVNPNINVFEEVKPLMMDLFSRQVIGDTPLETLLRMVLDLKSIYLKTPRQIDVLLTRMTSETLQWNFSLKELNSLRKSLDDSANRLSYSLVVGSLIIGAAIISSGARSQQLSLISNLLFAAASLLGLGLVISILRSGRLK